MSDKPHDAGVYSSQLPKAEAERLERMQKPATPAEAEALAKKAVADYLTACRLSSPDPATMGNYLMKLASVTGVMMACAEGSDIASDRLMGTAGFVAGTMPKKPATLRPVQ
jgi:hypothetical protein